MKKFKTLSNSQMSSSWNKETLNQVQSDNKKPSLSVRGKNFLVNDNELRNLGEGKSTVIQQNTCHPELDSGSQTFAQLNTRPSLEFLNSHTFAKKFFSPRGEMRAKAAFTLAEVLITLGIIGVVAALTIPALMTAYKKHVIGTKLKQSYSLLNQVVKMAQADYDGVEGWEYVNAESFVKTYFLPYMKADVQTTKSNLFYLSDMYTLTLLNGTTWDIQQTYAFNNIDGYTVGDVKYYIITVDINGSGNPNKQGHDKFNFYIFPIAAAWYNSGADNLARNVPSAGVYYDGYGYDDKYLTSSVYRGCNDNVDPKGQGKTNAYCVALIAKNNWKVPSDYPIKL
jgi:prepilin-type N-terminal cleavage/methylation domain-containing protein